MCDLIYQLDSEVTIFDPRSPNHPEPLASSAGIRITGYRQYDNYLEDLANNAFVECGEFGNLYPHAGRGVSHIGRRRSSSRDRKPSSRSTGLDITGDLEARPHHPSERQPTWSESLSAKTLTRRLTQTHGYGCNAGDARRLGIGPLNPLVFGEFPV